MMAKTGKKELMMVSLDKGIELYLSTLATEGKSPRYIDCYIPGSGRVGGGQDR